MPPLRVVDIPANLFFLAATHRFLFFPIVLVPAVILFRRSRRRNHLVGAAFILAMLNLIFGARLSSYLLYTVGEPGSAQIIDRFATSVRVNGDTVFGYKLLLKTAEGATVETSFADDDGNLYPALSGYVAPDTGDTFNVRYLPTFPEDFVLVTNEDSPWVHRVTCAPLEQTYYAADAKYFLDNEGPTYRAPYIAAIEALLAAHCDRGDPDYYRRALDAAKTGRK